MNKIDGKTETIFAHAVALDSSGRLRNTIYAIGKQVYILNSDHTVLLKFELSGASSPFRLPISFKANDYDSSTFYEEDGKIVFVQKSGDMERRKFSGKGQLEPEEVSAMFAGFTMKQPLNIANIHKDILPLLDENLSHIEFSGKNGVLKIIQRNIFDGTIIEITRKKETGMGVVKKDSIEENFGPFGLRTNDFIALFSFNDEVSFAFPSSECNFIYVQGRNYGMKGIISLCLYDEMGEITYSTGTVADESNLVWVYHPGSDDYCVLASDAAENPSDDLDILGPAIDQDLPELEKLIQEVYGHAGTGRKEQKERWSQQGADRQTEKRKCRRPMR